MIIVRKTGISVTSLGKRGCPFELNEDYFRLCSENNITAMEVNLPFGDDFLAIDFKKLAALAEKHGVELWSFHVPFSDYYDPSNPDDAEAENAMNDFKTLIKNASLGNVKNIVIHPSAEITTLEGRDIRMQKAKQRLSELADFAYDYGMTVAVETLPRLCLGNCTREMQELISLNPKLMICFDVNHIELGTHKEFMQALGSRVATVHISDYVTADDHLIPFNGKMDWKELIELFNAADYRGPFLYETSMYNPDNTMRAQPGTYHELHQKIESLKEI